MCKSVVKATKREPDLYAVKRWMHGPYMHLLQSENKGLKLTWKIKHVLKVFR